MPWLQHLRTLDGPQRLFAGFVLLLLGGGAAAALAHAPALLLPALLAVGLLVAVVEWRIIFYLLLFLLPFSIEIGLPGGFSMDVPSEPLMLVLTACVLITLLLRGGQLPAREWLHPLLLLMALMLTWAVFDTFFSVSTFKSIKYLLAKVWYIVPFVLGTLLLVRRPADVWRLALTYICGAAISVVYTAIRHATKGFSFADINWALRPFYLNHVAYAAVLALLLPYALMAWRAAIGRPRLRLLWGGLLAVLLFGLLTSYTRASLLSLPVAGIFYGCMRLRLTKVVLAAVALVVTGAAFYFLSNSNFMLYAPDFEKTIFNGKNFEKHLEATYKFEDVSGMERVYRWVAASRMISEKPITGSGPSTFYPEYKRFTIKSFRTYVSDNPEKSTTHNYFLLQLVEQGAPGFLLFVVFIATALLTAERLYHRSAANPKVRRVVLAATLSLVTIIFHLLLNELVEVDKIGPLYFMAIALLVRADSWLSDASLEEERERSAT